MNNWLSLFFLSLFYQRLKVVQIGEWLENNNIEIDDKRVKTRELSFQLVECGGIDSATIPRCLVIVRRKRTKRKGTTKKKRACPSVIFTISSSIDRLFARD